MSETGLSNVAVPTWQAIFAPPKTSPEVGRLLSQKINAALTDLDVREQFDRLFLKVEGSTPEKLAEQISRDIDIWRLFIRDNEIPRE